MSTVLKSTSTKAAGIDKKSVPFFFFAKKAISFMKGVDIYGFDHFCAVGDDSLEHY